MLKRCRKKRRKKNTFMWTRRVAQCNVENLISEKKIFRYFYPLLSNALVWLRTFASRKRFVSHTGTLRFDQHDLSLFYLAFDNGTDYMKNIGSAEMSVVYVCAPLPLLPSHWAPWTQHSDRWHRASTLFANRTEYIFFAITIHSPVAERDACIWENHVDVCSPARARKIVDQKL